MIAGIVLAAGESRRMGTPKPLIEMAGRSFLRHIVQQLQKADIDEIVVVLGYNAASIKANCGVSDVLFVVNDEYHNGQFSSLQTGIRTLDKKTEAAVICLVDQPHIKAAWIQELLNTFKSGDQPIVIPKHQGKRGHPVIYSSKLFGKITAMAATDNAHMLQANHKDEIAEVEISDRGILLDVDFPKDLDQIAPYFEL